MKTPVFTLILFFFGCTALARSQEGTLKGKVIEAETGEPLIGATIKIVQLQIGAVTDFDGNYQIQLNYGEYDIEVSYPGFQKKTISNVVISPDKVTIRNIELTATNLKTLEVVVIEERPLRKSKTVSIDGVEVRMSNKPEAVNYVPGVSTSQGYVPGNYQANTITRDDIAKIPTRSDAVYSQVACVHYNAPLIQSDAGNAISYEAEDIRKTGVRSKKSKRKKRSKNETETVEQSIETDQLDKEEKGLAEQAAQFDRIPDVATAYERYNPYTENAWVKASDEMKSTFGIDVDNASYTNFRRFVKQGQLPPKDAIRVEEWLNFFNYRLNAPDENDPHPLKIESEIGPCPWAPEDDLVMVKLQGKLPPKEHKNLPQSNLVFLVDVSGSMSSHNKLPLVQKSMKKLVNSLRAEDRISIVSYAGNSNIVLEPTAGDQKGTIIKAIESLSSGGGTHGSQGLITAYDLAEKNLLEEGNNRVIIATDGDWNIGVYGDESLKKLIEEKRETGVFLSVLGFGMGNLNDRMMELISNHGNGNYAYIDEEKEAQRIFMDEFAGTMHTIAKDVKLQIQFDSTVVESYRLIGYENRVLENWQFDADSIDAGDLGMGQNVIAFYQIKRRENVRGSIGFLDFRYKQPKSDVSTLLSHYFGDRQEEVSTDFNFASCVIEFAMCLRESEHRGNGQMSTAIKRGQANLGDPADKLSYDKRVEFVGTMENTDDMWTDYVVETAPDLDIQNAPELKLYPNPAADFTQIEVPEEFQMMWSIQIYSTSGALQKVEHFKETTTGRIDVNDLAPGTYIIKVYSGGFNMGYLRLVASR